MGRQTLAGIVRGPVPCGERKNDTGKRELMFFRRRNAKQEETIDQACTAGSKPSAASDAQETAHREPSAATCPPPVSTAPQKPEKAASEAQPENEGKGNFFGRIVRGLFKTRDSIVKRIRKAIRLKARLDDELLGEIEEILVQADVGVETTAKIIGELRLEVSASDPPDAILAHLKSSMEKILTKNERHFAVDGSIKPYVILVVGVNGTGKTTTIGKIAQKLAGEGRKVMIVAADTFRAAAIEQLSIWGERTGANVVKREMGADAAAVCYDALQQARLDGSDIVLIDTAGRLHTKKDLMEELSKIVRVIKKNQPGAPHETLLVLDATTGQNALTQAKVFTEKCGVTALVMTKLDGTAKGGVLIALRDQFEAPVLMIGVGESADDLRPFDAKEFVEALFSEEEEEMRNEKPRMRNRE